MVYFLVESWHSCLSYVNQPNLARPGPIKKNPGENRSIWPKKLNYIPHKNCFPIELYSNSAIYCAFLIFEIINFRK